MLVSDAGVLTVSKMRRLQIMFLAIVLSAASACLTAAQTGPTRRSTADDSRATIANDTFRELTKADRGNVSPDGRVSDAVREAALKQVVEDFKSIQDINNRMMADVWSSQGINYDRTLKALAEISTKATRLRNTLVLPEPETLKRPALTVSDLKEFKSSLMLMDRFLMSFVTNPIFREHKVLEVNLATQASRDLQEVVLLSADLKKAAQRLKKMRPASDR